MTNRYINVGSIIPIMQNMQTQEKKRFKIQHVIVPLLGAVIASSSVIIAAKISKNENPAQSQKSNCSSLIDSLKMRESEFSLLLISGNRNDSDQFELDSVMLRQSIYDIQQKINNNKCE